MTPAQDASTGPQSFDCGITLPGTQYQPESSCFNGAAVFRLRNYGARRAPHACHTTLQRGRSLSTAEFTYHYRICLTPRSASTGPQSFDCGIVATVTDQAMQRSLLQRGRSLSTAEFTSPSPLTFATPCFNGAAVFRLRNYIPAKSSVSIRAASTGPQSFDCGILTRKNRAVKLFLASTGPQSFDCGIIFAAVSWSDGAPSFNGAAVFRLRNLPNVPPRRKRGKSFNGAAVFRLRNSPSPRRSPTAPSRFNGAAVFRLRNSHERPPTETFQSRFNGAAVFRLRNSRSTNRPPARPFALQRGRSLSTAEFNRLAPQAARPVRASTGPQSFDCGIFPVSSIFITATRTLQRGRSLSTAEFPPPDLK